MNSLYDISQKYVEAFENLNVDEETGEIIDFDIIEALTQQFDEKIENIACYIKNNVSMIAALKAEEATFSDRRKRLERRVDGLKRYITSCMDTVGRDRFETPLCRITFRKSESVNIEDEDKIPAEYIVVVEQRKPDKAAMKKAIQSGQVIDGISLLEKRNIQIK